MMRCLWLVNIFVIGVNIGDFDVFGGTVADALSILLLTYLLDNLASILWKSTGSLSPGGSGEQRLS